MCVCVCVCVCVQCTHVGVCSLIVFMILAAPESSRVAARPPVVFLSTIFRSPPSLHAVCACMHACMHAFVSE